MTPSRTLESESYNAHGPVQPQQQQHQQREHNTATRRGEERGSSINKNTPLGFLGPKSTKTRSDCEFAFPARKSQQEWRWFGRLDFRVVPLFGRSFGHSSASSLNISRQLPSSPRSHVKISTLHCLFLSIQRIRNYDVRTAHFAQRETESQR
jgi:hypothetical protein